MTGMVHDWNRTGPGRDVRSGAPPGCRAQVRHVRSGRRAQALLPRLQIAAGVVLHLGVVAPQGVLPALFTSDHPVTGVPSRADGMNHRCDHQTEKRPQTESRRMRPRVTRMECCRAFISRGPAARSLPLPLRISISPPEPGSGIPAPVPGRQRQHTVRLMSLVPRLCPRYSGGGVD